MPPKMNTAQEEEEDEQDDNLIAMASPTNSPAHKSQIKNSTDLKYQNGSSAGMWDKNSSMNTSNIIAERAGKN